MRYTYVKGHTRTVRLSKIAFGGAVVSDFKKWEYYFQALEKFAELGGNLIDTGLCYGGWSPHVPSVIEIDIPENTTGSWHEHGYSSSELMIGQWMKSRKRGDTVISTKGAHPVFGINEKRVTPEFINRDINCSLRNLDVECIDIYFLHRDDFDRTYPVSKIIDELNRHIDRGEIEVIGASNWTSRRIEEANEYAAKHGLAGFSVNQIWFSLADITEDMMGDRTLLYLDSGEYDRMKKLGMTVMAYSSQAKGFFSKYADKTGEAGNSRFGSEKNISRLRRAAELARTKNLTPGEIAVAYLTSLDIDVIPIIGFSNLGQLEESTLAGNILLTKAETDYLSFG